MNLLRSFYSISGAILWLVVVMAGMAHAGDKVFDELRFEQSIYWDEGKHPEDGTFTKAMVFFDPLDSAHASSITDFVFSPRVHVGATVALGGGTSQVFTGLNWTVNITDQLFFDVGAGGTIHNGDLEFDGTPGPKLGSRVLFWHYYALGLKMNQNWSLIASWDHSSHAEFCDKCANQGLTHVGLSLGYKF